MRSLRPLVRACVHGPAKGLLLSMVMIVAISIGASARTGSFGGTAPTDPGRSYGVGPDGVPAPDVPAVSDPWTMPGGGGPTAGGSDDAPPGDPRGERDLPPDPVTPTATPTMPDELGRSGDHPAPPEDLPTPDAAGEIDPPGAHVPQEPVTEPPATRGEVPDRVSR